MKNRVTEGKNRFVVIRKLCVKRESPDFASQVATMEGTITLIIAFIIMKMVMVVIKRYIKEPSFSISPLKIFF